MKIPILLCVLILATAAVAQTVNVTGTVADANGNVYVNGSGVISLVPSNQQWLFNGTNPVNSPVPIGQLSSSGQFSVQLINTSLISPASANPQWQFSFCSNAQLTKTPICFTMTPLALTSSQDISTQIKAQAAILPRSGGSCITTVANLTAQCGAIISTIASVTDGANSSDCTIGGGSSSVICIYTGTQWIFGGSSAPNPAFNQIGSGINANALQVSGSLTPVTVGTITATSLSASYIDWNAVSGGAFIKNKPTLNVWSNLVAPTANLPLNTGTFTTTFTSGDFGASPVTGVHNYTTTATSTTDTSFEMAITSPAGSFHNPFIATVGANQLFAACSTGGASPTGFVVVGIFTPSMTCPLLTQTPFSRFWDIVASSSHVGATFYEAANGYTANLTQLFAHTPAGTGFNFLVTCAGANNTGGTCTSPLDTIRGDGLFTAPIVNATTGYQINGTATLNHCLVGNGTNYVDSVSCGTGGFPSGVGIAGAVVSGTPLTSAIFLPPVDVRLFFTTPYPTYAQAQSQDFGAVLNAALLAATPSGACVDVSGLNQLNNPNIAVYPVTTNIFAGLISNTYVPCIIGANFQLVTGVTQSTPGGSIRIEGGAPGGIGGTGMVIQPCNTNTTGCVIGSVTVPQFPTSATCATSGGLNCRATGLPSSSALVSYNTGTIAYTLNSTTVTGTGVTWTSAMIGGTLVSACPANTCTIGSTSGYTTGHIVNVSGSTITLESGWTAASNSGQNYIIFRPNTSVAFCDACLGNNLQKSFTGHQITNLTIDLNGISGAGFYTKSSQEGSILTNFTCFEQFGTPTGATAGGTCLAWDQTVREAANSNETFLGHWSVYGGRIGMGQNAGGALAFGAVVEGFSIMDGTVALSQANGASVFELQAIIGGGGSARFQDTAYIDGISGMYIAGTHTESTFNDHWNIGPVNPTYNINLNGITSSGTLGGSVVEFHSGSSGNQIHGVSRPSGGVLITDDNLTTPTVATSVSGTPASWTVTEFLQQGNSGISLYATGNASVTGIVSANSFQFTGPLYLTGPIPASAMSPSVSGSSAIGISNDGNCYISNNAAAIDECATAANTLTFTNKTISGSSNTLSNIGNAALTNSAITIAGTSVSLGGSTTAFPSPGVIGGTTPAAITGTTIQANTQINAGVAGTLAPIVMGNATSGLLTIEPTTGAITSYTIGFPVAQPTAGNTFLSCTAANPAVCTWSAATAGAVALSSLTAAIASNTLANGNNPQTWNWAQTTASQTAFTFGETSAATGAGDGEVGISTASASTAVPLTVKQGSITGTTAIAALQVNTTLNNAGLTNTCVICSNVTNTASNGTSRWLLFNGGVAGTVNELAVDMSGNVFSAGATYTGLATGTTATLCGGASSSCTTTVNNVTGGVFVQGEDNSNTGASAKSGTAILRSGMLTGTANASAIEGLTQIGQGYQSNGTVTQWLVQCGTLTQYEVTDCAITPAINVIGVATNTQATVHGPVGIIPYGQTPITFDGATTLGDIACLSTTTAGNAHDNGTVVCTTAGAQLGVIVANSGAVTSMSNNSTASVTLSSTLALVQLHFR